MPRLLPLLLLVPGLLLAAVPAPSVHAEEGRLLRNDAFETWQDGLPVGWTRSIGARRDPGDTPATIRKLSGNGVVLAGDAKTNLWPMLSQRVRVEAGAFLDLQFRARVLGAKREAGQFGSCYVGFVLRDVNGKPSGFTVQDIRSAEWQGGHVRMKLPDGTAQVDVALFLSQTGQLEVNHLWLRVRPAEESFDILVSEMDRQYSFFAAHDLDWQQLAHRHARKARAAQTPAAFIEALTPLLAELKDGHVWIQAPDGARTNTWAPRITPNFEIQPLLPKLEGMQQVVRNVLSATTADGFGYLAIGTMQLTPQQYGLVERAFRANFDKPGIILDLRVNGGGQEVWGQRLCSFLTKERVLYGRAKIRSGPKHTDLMPEYFEGQS